MTTDTAAKRDIQKLQRAIVDGLEDVKAQDIQVFDTEHLTSLFERVIVASGTSNRQTKALAASVRDKVRDAGFPKPRVEGEANGEWIIVDCAQAVVHVMQPTYRSYYHLGELWGEKPVRLKFGAAKPVLKVVAVKAAAKKAAAKKATPGKAVPRKALANVSSTRSVTAKPAPGKAAAGAAKTPAKAPARASVKAPASAPAKTSKVATKRVARKSPGAKR